MAAEKRAAEKLKQLRRRIDHWRRTRRKFGPMPQPLWDEAAALARSLGVCPVSRALGIGYQSLKRQVRSPGVPQPAVASAPGIGFVELTGAQLVGASAASNAPSVVIEVELASRGGSRLTIRLPAGTPLDLGSLFRAFEGCEA